MSQTGQDTFELRRRPTLSAGGAITPNKVADDSVDETGGSHLVSGSSSTSFPAASVGGMIASGVNHDDASRASLIQKPVTISSAATYQRNQEAEEELKKKRLSSSSSIFFILSVFSAVVVAINFICVALLEKVHKHHYLWVNIPAAAAFLSMGVIMILYLTHGNRWCDARDTWVHAERPRRISWVGILLSILIPLILCQFLYMNASAVPTFQKKTWATKLDYEDSIVPPALLIVRWNRSRSPQAEFVPSPSTEEQCRYDAETSEDSYCINNMQFNVINSTLAYSYHLFSPFATQKQAANITLRESKFVTIQFGLTWNGSTDSGVSPEPYLYYAFIDPRFIRDLESLHDILSIVERGGCSLITGQYFPVLGYNYIGVEQTEIHDAVDALKTNASACSVSNKPYSDFRRYASYRITLNHLRLINQNVCDFGSKDYRERGVCPSVNYIHFSTNMVTTQTSSHGTDWKKIIVDEGSIVGGVMFFTWFLGLYVL